MIKTSLIAVACAISAAAYLPSCEVLFPSTVAGDVSDGGGSGTDTAAPMLDAGAADGDATVRDAATDALFADATFGGPFCVVHAAHTHCFDFDSVGNAMVGWDGNNLGGGTAVALDPTFFRSSPNSMRSSVQNGGPTGTYAVLTENLPLDASQLVLAADVRPELPPGATYEGAELLGTHVTGTFGYYGVGVGFSQAGPALSVLWPTDDAGGYASRTETFQSLVADDAGWTRIEMTVDFGPPLAVALTFNGLSEWNGPFSGTAAVVGATPAGVAVGVVAVGDGGPIAVNYDNVTIDVK